MKEIETYITKYLGITGSDLSPTAQLFRSKSFKKGDFIVRTNQYVNQMFFVKKGYARMFAHNPSGDKEVTQWISTEGMFLTDLSSFMFGTPSRWCIEALTELELYAISKTDYQSIGDYVKIWDELEKTFLAKCFTAIEDRVFAQLSMTAEEKVKDLLIKNPNLFLKVPLQYIASMLGMTPETLSRIRKKMIS